MSLFITLQLPWSQSWLCLLIYILYPETEAKHHNLTGLLNAAPLLSFSTLKINKNARIGLEIRHISKECFPAMAAKLENSLILRHLQLYRYTPSTDVYKSTLFRVQHLLSVLQSFTQKYFGVWKFSYLPNSGYSSYCQVSWHHKASIIILPLGLLGINHILWKKEVHLKNIIMITEQ